MRLEIFLLSLATALLLSGATIVDSYSTTAHITPQKENILASLQGQVGHNKDSVPVIITLKSQEFHETANDVRKKYKERIEKLTEEARMIYKKTMPLTEEKARTLEVNKIKEMEESTLTASEKSRLNQLAERIDSIKDQHKAEAMEKHENIIRPLKEKIENYVTNCGGIITGSSDIINSMFVRMPVSCIEKLKANPDITGVYTDKQMQVNLDTSICSIGSPTWHNAGFAGDSWDVAVADTGIDSTHPALNVKSAKTFHTAALADAKYADNPNSTDDLYGHGTQMAGIIVSNDSTFRGVAPGAGLINAKFCYKRSESPFALCMSSDGIEAIDWAIKSGADVVSRSLSLCDIGSSDCIEAVYLDAIADDLGVHVVNSAGNDGPAGGSVSAIAYNIFSVAATDNRNSCSVSGDVSDDSIAGFSSRGPTSNNRVKPDIAAPGLSIRSPNNNWEAGTIFTDTSGTSPAAPHVAGAILLLLDYKGFAWDTKAVKAILHNTANSSGAFSDRNSSGWGHLDLSHAYLHKDDIFLGNIAQGSNKFYKGSNMTSGDKATAVWNRHAVYNASENTTFFPINDMDLYMYDEETGSLIDQSITGFDNVEQVKANSSYNKTILRIHAFTENYSHNSDIEEYALATEENHAKAVGPVLAITSEPKTTTDNLLPIEFAVSASNLGDINAHNLNMSLNISSGLTNLSNITQYIDKLEYGETKNFTWNLTGDIGNYSSSFFVNSFSYGTVFTDSNTSSINISDDDSQPPDITDFNFTENFTSENTDAGNDIVISVRISDTSGIKTAVLHYDLSNDNKEDGHINMSLFNTSFNMSWTAIIPFNNSFFSQKNMSFFVDAEDNDSDRPNDTASVNSTAQLINFITNASDNTSSILIIGNKENITTNIQNITLLINNSSNFSDISDTQLVEIKEGENSLIEFLFDFNHSYLNLTFIKIEKQTNATHGYLLINGINLTLNQTKIIYMDIINNTGSVCIKDSEISNITEITTNCSGVNETYLVCNNVSLNNYTCINQTNKYKITGLMHSGVQEFSAFCGDTVCRDGESAASCPEDCPAPQQAPTSPTTNGGGGGGGSARRVVIIQNETNQTKTITLTETPIQTQTNQEIPIKENLTENQTQNQTPINETNGPQTNQKESERITGFAVLSNPTILALATAIIIIIIIIFIKFRGYYIKRKPLKYQSKNT